MQLGIEEYDAHRVEVDGDGHFGASTHRIPKSPHPLARLNALEHKQGPIAHIR